ncbi:MAG: hypothetical protein ACO3LH_11085 [Steroidobacteraceae bacterium]
MAVIGTGPSLTASQVDTARRKGFELYVCNNAFLLAPDAALLHACNAEWWDCYWEKVKDLPARKTTIFADTARKYGIEFVPGIWQAGLAEKPRISYGHSSGFQLLNLAYHQKPDRIVLLGYDMKYAPDYDGRARQVGSTPRHFFGEYESALQHWPSQQVRNGFHVELIELYNQVARLNKVEIVNATPDSALECFPKVDIDKL